MDLSSKKFLVTGGSGFLGSFVVEELQRRGVPAGNILIPRRSEYDLREKSVCEQVVQGRDFVIHLAANVGGIGYNRRHPGELFYDNIMMCVQLMESARKKGVEKFVGVATICAYPKFTPIPFKEEDLWEGYPEESNAAYGLAKKMLLVQAQAYRDQYGMNAITLFPVNLYGPRDHFDLENSHVIPALIKKFVDAKQEGKNFVEVWGTGKATREFLYVEDAARAIVLATERYNGRDPVNIGSGMEISIKDLASMLARMTGFDGEIRWDDSRPDGQLRRMLDVSRAKQEFSFSAETSFEEGLKRTIEWYLKNQDA